MKYPTFKKGDTVRIVNAMDANGKKFVPIYVNYKVINMCDNTVDIGIGDIVKHTLKIKNIELENPPS